MTPAHDPLTGAPEARATEPTTRPAFKEWWNGLTDEQRENVQSKARWEQVSLSAARSWFPEYEFDRGYFDETGAEPTTRQGTAEARTHVAMLWDALNIWHDKSHGPGCDWYVCTTRRLLDETRPEADHD